jgi:hypothetical protein
LGAIGSSSFLQLAKKKREKIKTYRFIKLKLRILPMTQSQGYFAVILSKNLGIKETVLPEWCKYKLKNL